MRRRAIPPWRTGALRYIRHGWAIPQVAYLGRWKSDVIYQYAAEALESFPVNTNRAFISDLYGTKDNDGGPVFYRAKDVEEVRDYLLAELMLAREHQERALKAMDFEVESLKKRSDRNNGKLPPYIQALNSRIIHHNWKPCAAGTTTRLITCSSGRRMAGRSARSAPRSRNCK